MIEFAVWWVIIQVFGLAALPTTIRVFAWLPDRGYAFSKTIGLLLVSYLLWAGASTGLLINNSGGILLALLLVALVSGMLILAQGSAESREQWRAFWHQNRTQIVVVEILLLLTFAGWTLVRAYAPDKILPAGGEKYMEIAFLNGVLNSSHFPPMDPWMSGFGISYYYFGYVMMGVMTALSGAAPGVGFDLYDALLFALTAVTSYGIAANLVRSAGGSRQATTGSGLLGALFVGGLGNLLGLFEGLHSSRALPASFFTWLNVPDLATAPQSGTFYPGHGWWWWRASRVLMDLNLRGEPAVYQPIDEFPFFSFLLGDNHPHKLALPFVLLSIGVALNLFLRTQDAADTQPHLAPGNRRYRIPRLERSSATFYLFYAVVLGSLGFLNTWDFPIYLALVILADATGRYLTGQRSFVVLIFRGLVLSAGLGVASVLLYVFFYLGFTSQAGGILPYIFPPTRLSQYLILFGPFIFILAFFLPLVVKNTRSDQNPLKKILILWLRTAGVIYGVYLLAVLLGLAILQVSGLNNQPLIQSWLNGMNLQEVLGRLLLARITNPWLFLLLSALLALAFKGILSTRQDDSTTAFVLLLAVLGIGLTLSVEFFFLRDNFGARMNTIFKFYFQGWVLLALASVYGIWWISRNEAGVLRTICQAGTALLVGAALIYPIMGIYSRTEGFSNAPVLDASASFAGKYPGHWAAQPDDWAAIQWLKQNGRGADGSIPVVLEAGSGGYENAGRISAFTGYPTVLGWTNHEGQWRGSNEEIALRAPDIEEIYSTGYSSVALDLLNKWDVRFVIVGNEEVQYIGKICQSPERTCHVQRALNKFNDVLIPVFTQGDTTIYQVPD